MVHKDLREWLDLVEKHGELKHVKGADPILEMCSIMEYMAQRPEEPKPTVIFEDIKGVGQDHRAVCGIFGTAWRLAKTLGLPEDESNRMALLRNWRSKLKNMPLIPPKVVTSAPILENVDTGDKINLLKFPVPKVHEYDGGRYWGTCHGVVQRDPDSGYVNIGTYRSMLVDKNHLAMHILEAQHGGIIMYKKYFARGKKMPVVIVVGMDPTLWFSSCHKAVPWGVSEYDFTGGIKGQAIEVIEGKFTGLPIPAYAEIAIEGEIDANNMVDEGPFGEWHGYYGNFGFKPVPEPIVDVKAVYYRNNPIFSFQNTVIPSYDSSNMMLGLGNASAVWNRLEGAGLSGIKGVWCHSEVTGESLFTVVSIDQLYKGHSRDVGLEAAMYANVGRYTIVVEEDIDPSSLKEVIWAICTRGKPQEAIQMLNYCRTQNSDTTIPISEKRKYKIAPKPLSNSRVIIDACRPIEEKDEWYAVSRMSPELWAKTDEKWKTIVDGFWKK
jgi:4-hydroxy-3-polyprenylbenzoate decarboxylase